jgi:hypothetical protein
MPTTRRTLLYHAALGGLASTSTFETLAKDPLPTAPAEVRTAMPGAHWIGSGRLRYFGLSVYDASLWALPDFKVAQLSQQRFALCLTYLRAFTATEIAQRSLQEIRRMHQVAPDTARVWLTALQEVMPDVAAGDRITALHPPGGVSFWHQGRSIGGISDTAFGSHFFDIWLSVSTSEPKLRNALLARATP